MYTHTHTHARTHARMHACTHPPPPQHTHTHKHTFFFWLTSNLKHSVNYNKTKFLNPFTAMLGAPSLEKRPVKVRNLKSLRLFYPFAWADERISVKMHSVGSRFVIGPSNILSAGMYVFTFQPGNFTGFGSEGVKQQNTKIETLNRPQRINYRQHLWSNILNPGSI